MRAVIVLEFDISDTTDTRFVRAVAHSETTGADRMHVARGPAADATLRAVTWQSADSRVWPLANKSERARGPVSLE